MNLETALAAYLVTSALFTITPGLDTALVLRTAAVDGPRAAARAGSGIICGCFVWGLSVALGLGILLTASHLAYDVLKWGGCLYLAWLGINLIVRPRKGFAVSGAPQLKGANWWARGFLNNLLNPKCGVFYISFLPQFVPIGYAPGPFMALLALIHAVLGALWFALLISATAPLKRWLQRQAVVRWIDRVTGAVFVGFGLRLAFDRR